jgi:hypothetical protein
MGWFDPNQDPNRMEAERRDADARHERERVEAEQHHELKLARQAERSKHASWWRRLVNRLRGT